MLAPYMNNYPNRCYLIQDNDSKHTSHLCQNTLTENNIQWVNLFYNYMCLILTFILKLDPYSSI